VSVQAGVESLSSSVLKLMDKGVTGFHNVRLLRDSETVGLTVIWNYLYGFPGEPDEDYAAIIEQMPALHHLYPPEGMARIALERFSPFFNNPELGFAERAPHRQYRLAYDLPESELHDLAYLFETPPLGIDQAMVDRLDSSVGQWQSSYDQSRLGYTDFGSHILLANSRAGFSWETLNLTAEAALALFRHLDQPRRRDRLPDRLAELTGTRPESVRIDETLAAWRDLGLVFEESGHVIQVAVEERNQEVMRVGGVTRA